MADFARTLSSDVGVHITDNDRINCILWADDIILLSETEEGLNKLLSQLKLYSDQNQLKVNTDKTKCMIFNKTGRLLRRNFYLGDNKRLDVQISGTYRYTFGEIRSALVALRSRALKAYMAMKSKLGVCFKDCVADTVSLFESLVKPILVYGMGVTFGGALSYQRTIR